MDPEMVPARQGLISLKKQRFVYQTNLCFFLVREKGLEPSRLWLDTGTSSLPVYLFQHSRVSRRESNYSRISRFVNRNFLLHISLFRKLLSPFLYHPSTAGPSAAV